MSESARDSDGEPRENYDSINIDLNESDMESLRHGSSISFEFDGKDDYVLAVHVGREDKELDKEWLLGEEDTELPDAREYKALAGIAAVMVGVGQAAVSFVDVAPQITGGVLAVLGGIYVIEQMRAVRDASESRCSA